MCEDKIKLKNDSQIKIADDKFSRSELAKKYAKFIRNLDGHHVVALDAPWGSGKSTLLEFMCEEFENKNDAFIKYNAWENDYTEEPLLSLMSDIHQEFQKKEYIGTDEWKSFVSHMVKATKLFSKGTLKGISKVILGTESTTDLGNACLEVSSAITDEVANNLFKDIDESKKSRKEFKKELEKYTKTILEEKGKDKLIIIIDELDRCRPTFAIQLLENIKHLFDIQNIVFLIAVDTDQLAESIKSVYGNGFDANTYLHRFFDIELWLNNQNFEKYFQQQMQKSFPHEFDKFSVENKEKLYKFLMDIFEYANLTIRDIHKIVNEYFVLYTLKNSVSIENMEIYLSLLILKNKYKYCFDILNTQNNNPFNSNNFINNINNHKALNLLLKYIIKGGSPNYVFRENTYKILKEISKTSE